MTTPHDPPGNTLPTGLVAEDFGSFGPYSELGDPTVSVVNPAGIHIGAFVKIGRFAVLESLVPERGVSLRIDDGAYIGHFTRITAVASVHIGEEAMLADRVYVSDTNHIYEDPSVPIKRQGLRDGRRIEIGRGAWIGIGAVLVGNLSIGENAVVAANSVVRADVPARTVVAGDPAVPVRHHDGDEWQWAHQRAPS